MTICLFLLEMNSEETNIRTRGSLVRIRNARERWEARRAELQSQKLQEVEPPLPSYEIPKPVPWPITVRQKKRILVLKLFSL